LITRVSHARLTLCEGDAASKAQARGIDPALVDRPGLSFGESLITGELGVEGQGISLASCDVLQNCRNTILYIYDTCGACF
jgi:hypothetical protein